MAVFLHPDKMRDVENARECFEQVRQTNRKTKTHRKIDTRKCRQAEGWTRREEDRQTDGRTRSYSSRQIDRCGH